MIDYEGMILARQELYDEPVDLDCRFCPYLENCRTDEEQEIPHHCYMEDEYES